MKVIFWGTPDFSQPALKLLMADSLIKIVSVITQPDKPQGRSKKLISSPIKSLAVKHGLKVLTPTTLDDDFFNQSFKKLSPSDVNLIVAYGKLIPAKFLNYSLHGSVNLHPSLLPKYRGPSPIQSALLNGDSVTGVSVMLLDNKMDHGDLLSQKKINILKRDNYNTLSVKLAKLGAELLIDTLPKYISGQLKSYPQDHQLATYCRLLTKDDGKLAFNLPAEVLLNKINMQIKRKKL